jgi:hypothetical protein
MRNAYKNFIGKTEWKRPLERYRQGDIKMELKEIGLEGMDLIQLAKDRDCWRPLVSTVMNILVA